jgi:hypothetical protein
MYTLRQDNQNPSAGFIALRGGNSMTKNSSQHLNNKENTMKGIRHGELILIPREGLIGKFGKKIKSFIVAHSETGHHHVIESETPFTVDEKHMYIQLFGDSAIVHRKTFDFHKTLPLKPAIHERYEAVEYDPFAAVTRRVVD